MQNVSDAWKKNLNAITRKQGFVLLTITMEDGTEVSIDSRTSGNRISDIVHTQTYDPIGLTLPSNNIIVDLYNYSDAYTEWYTDNNHPVKAVVQYGFMLDTAEIIKGGTFYINEISLDDDILSLSGVSSLENKLDDVEVKIDDISGLPFQMYSQPLASDVTTIYADDVIEPEGTTVTAKEVVDAMDAIMPCSSNEALSSIIAFYSRSTLYSPDDIVQSIANGSLQRVRINRDDILIFENAAPTQSRQIAYKNNKEKIRISKTSRVSSVESNYPVSGTGAGDTETLEVAERTTERVEGTTETYDCVFYFECDFYAYMIQSITFSNDTNRIKLYCGYFELSDGRIIAGYQITCRRNRYAPTITFTVQERSTTTTQTIRTENSDSGKVCDITNDYCAVTNTDKIVSYYNNDLLYDLELRGYPEIDVGDYIEVQKADGSYDVCLVLSHELEFDGKFVSRINCRRITEIFEASPKGTHLDLSQYAHQQLGAYTHQQLSEGVI